MKFAHGLLTTTLALLIGGAANAGVTPEEAAELGKSLTLVGAQKAGNAEGTIPEFTGGLPVDTAPPGYTKGDAYRPNPFAEEKPRLVITGKNLAEHKDKLTAVSQELLSRFPGYRLDVYPTHRTVTIPQAYQENTVKNATGAKIVDGGLGMENALPGIPFPIPKIGSEVMWNHAMRYNGQASRVKYDSWNVDSSGTPVLASTGTSFVQYPLIDPDHYNTPAAASEVFTLFKLYYTAPTRRVGEALMVHDSVNPILQPRKAWQYLPGQRRVKLAPDICCDTPNPATMGSSTYDDAFVFNGTLERFDWKLVGKKEMYIPYNAYKLTYEKDPLKFLPPNYLDPDFVRWELHRVWVVEATLKTGQRHIYSKRTFYVDEDSWTALAADSYDARGELFRGTFAFSSPSWDVQANNTTTNMVYDLIGGTYNISGVYGPHFGIEYIDNLSKTQWSAQALSGSGIR